MSPQSNRDDPPKLGPETAGLLLAIFQDAYRHEVAAEEDVHRTLPFFATALSLLIAAINYVAGQVPPWRAVVDRCPALGQAVLSWPAFACAWPEMLATLLIVLATLLGVGVLWMLALAVARHRYGRAGPEDVNLTRAKELQSFGAYKGLAGSALDRATAGELLAQVVEDYAAVIPHNRALTQRRYARRSWAVLGLLWSLLCVIAATIIIIGAVKLQAPMQGSR